MNDDSLIIAIDVAALPVGQGDIDAGSRTLSNRADFSRLPSETLRAPYTSEAVLANATPFEGLQDMVAGVHLHWALPKVLTRGQAGDSGLSFPAVPDRWLVTRVVVAPGVPARLRSWVVESDRLSETPTVARRMSQPTLPLSPTRGERSYACLGQAFAAQGWQEQVGDDVQRASRPFTALGHGDPSFAAFYPDCCSVFGFHDDLADVVAGEKDGITLTYQVTGWYANPDEDPLHQADAIQRFAWGEDDGPLPARLLCSGVVDGLPWVRQRRYLDDTPRPLTLAIAASSREALSALMADDLRQRQPGQPEDIEQLLNALQFDLLSGSAMPDAGQESFEEAVHDAGFVTLSGGASWNIDREEGPDTLDAATLPARLAEPLDQLNRLQAECNDRELDCQARQAQLFIHWYKYQTLVYDPDTVPEALQNALQALIDWLQQRSDDITALQAGLALLRQDIAAQAQRLRELLPDGLLLAAQTAAPRYYQPSDPMLMLCGADVQPMARYAGDDERGWRRASRLIDSVSLAQGALPGSAGVQSNSAALPGLPITAGLPLANVFRALWVDAVHVSPGLQPVLLAALASQALAGNPARIDPGACLALLLAGSTALCSGQAAPLDYRGEPPGPRYCQRWEGIPWLPLLVQFQVEFSPVVLLDDAKDARYPADFIQRHFSFDDDAIDLHYHGASPDQRQAFSATALLSPNATLDLADTIGRYLDNLDQPDPQLQALRDRVSQLPILAQGLSGFNEALLMRHATLQMPVADPIAMLPLVELADTVAAAVDGENRAAPLPQNSFNPLRSGELYVSRLRLVDAFGRFKDYPAPRSVIAHGLAGSTPDRAFLPPRITQPARLQFRWRAATQAALESSPSSATSPILGWVMPNHLDHALMLYAANGRPLGELALSGTRVLWTAAPLGDFPLGSSVSTVFAGQPEDFARFAEGLYQQGDASFFAPFLQTVNDALSFSLPAQFAETAQQVVLTGQPLVLTRASLALQLAGPAASNQSWSSFQRSLLDDAPADDAQLPGVEFPLRLGALTQLDDTLVGYWLDPRCAEDFRHFLAPYADAAQGGVAPPRQDSLTLRADGTAREVVMLLDPRGCVHASSGILPVKSIDIPSRHYAATLAAFDVTFESFPLLSGSHLPCAPGQDAPLGMVLPRVASGDWHWISSLDGTWHSRSLVDSASATPALDHTPQSLLEGWLGIRRAQPPQRHD